MSAVVGSRAGATTVLLALPEQMVGQPLPASAVTATQSGRTLPVEGGRTGPPDTIEVVLVLDPSARTPLPDVRSAASAVLRTLPPESRAAVVVADPDPAVRQVLAADPSRGLPAVADLRQSDGATLVDSFRLAVQQVLPSDPNRQQHVVVVASGPDRGSSSDLAQTIALATRRGIAVDVLDLGAASSLPELGPQCPPSVAAAEADAAGTQVARRIADRRRLVLPPLTSPDPVTIQVTTEQGTASTVLDRRDDPAPTSEPRGRAPGDGVGLGTLLLAFVVGLVGLTLLLLLLAVRSRRGRLALDALRSIARCGLQWARERGAPDPERRLPRAELRRRLADAVQDLRAGLGEEPTAVELAWENALLDQAIWAEDQARERLRRERLDARAKASARIEAALRRAQERAAIERAAREAIELAAADLGELSEREKARLAQLEEVVADRLAAAQRAVAQAEEAAAAEQAAAERAAAQRAEAERAAARAAALAAEQIAAAERARVEREEAEREAARLAELLAEQRDRAHRANRQQADDEAAAAARLQAARQAVADAEESAAAELAAAARATMQRAEAERAAASAATLAAEQTEAARRARVEREQAEHAAVRATELFETHQAVLRGQPAGSERAAEVEPAAGPAEVEAAVEVEPTEVESGVELAEVESAVEVEPAEVESGVELAEVEPAAEAEPVPVTVDLRAPVAAVPAEQSKTPAAPEALATPTAPVEADTSPVETAGAAATTSTGRPPVIVALRVGPRTGRSRRQPGFGRPRRPSWPGEAQPPDEPPTEDPRLAPVDWQRVPEPAEPLEPEPAHEPEALEEPKEPEKPREPWAPQESHEPEEAHEAGEPEEAHEAGEPEEAHEAGEPEEAHEPEALEEPREPEEAHEAGEPEEAHEPEALEEPREPEEAHEAREPEEAHEAREPEETYEREPEEAPDPEEAHEPEEPRQKVAALTVPPASPVVTVPVPSAPAPVHLVPEPEDVPAPRLPVSAHMAAGSPVVRLTAASYRRSTDFAGVRRRLLDLRAETRAGSDDLNLEARVVRWVLVALVPLVVLTRTLADPGWIAGVVGDIYAAGGLLVVALLTGLGGLWVWRATSPPFVLRRGPSVRAEWQLVRSLNVAEQLALRLAAGSPPDSAVQRVARLNHVPIGPFSAATPGLAVAMAVRLRRDLQRRRGAFDGRVAAAAIAPLLVCLLPAVVLLCLL